MDALKWCVTHPQFWYFFCQKFQFKSVCVCVRVWVHVSTREIEREEERKKVCWCSSMQVPRVCVWRERGSIARHKRFRISLITWPFGIKLIRKKNYLNANWFNSHWYFLTWSRLWDSLWPYLSFNGFSAIVSFLGGPGFDSSKDQFFFVCETQGRKSNRRAH